MNYYIVTLLILVPLGIHGFGISSTFVNSYILPIFIVVAITAFTSKRDKFNLAINFLLFFAFLLTIAGIIEEFTHVNLYALINHRPVFQDFRFGLLRISTIFTHSINYVNFLMGITLLIIYKYKQANSNIVKKRLQFLYALVVLNLLFANARSTTIILIFTNLILFYFAGYLNRKNIVKALIFSLVGVFVAMFSQSFRETVMNFVYMLLAIFFPSFQEKISSSFGGSNIDAIGQRDQLYIWVWERLRGYEWLGVGNKITFWVKMYPSGTKTSIENEYLFTLWRTGIVGLAIMISQHVYLLGSSLKNFFKSKEKLNFNLVMFVFIFGLVLSYFAVAIQQEKYFLYIMIGLFFSNNTLARKEE